MARKAFYNAYLDRKIIALNDDNLTKIDFKLTKLRFNFFNKSK